MISSFFPSIFACIRPANNTQTSSAPLRSQSFDFFNSLEFDEEAGTITHTSGDKKHKSRNSHNKNGSKKGRVSLTSCIVTPKNKEKSRNCELICYIMNYLFQIFCISLSIVKSTTFY